MLDIVLLSRFYCVMDCNCGWQTFNDFIESNACPNNYICFISEFGEEFKGLRKELTCIFSEIFKQDNVTFIPADIGLKCRFSDLKTKAVVKVRTSSEKDSCN